MRVEFQLRACLFNKEEYETPWFTVNYSLKSEPSLASNDLVFVEEMIDKEGFFRCLKLQSGYLLRACLC